MFPRRRVLPFSREHRLYVGCVRVHVTSPTGFLYCRARWIPAPASKACSQGVAARKLGTPQPIFATTVRPAVGLLIGASWSEACSLSSTVGFKPVTVEAV